MTADDSSLDKNTNVSETNILKDIEELAIGRAELKNINGLLQFVAGLSAVGVLNPPGGVDANGLARFRKNMAYKVFFTCANLAFLLAVFDCVYLSSRIPRYIARCKALLRKGWISLAASSVLLLGAFVAGIFLLIPVKECVDKVCVMSFLPWLAPGAAVAKVVSSTWDKWSA